MAKMGKEVECIYLAVGTIVEPGTYQMQMINENIS